MKLICFTYAGGNSSFYDQLKNELLPNVNLIAAEYSGHGTRHRSPFYSDFDELANDMLVQIEKELDEKEPFAIMGYSMGSIAAIEVLSKLMVKKMPLPIHVFLAAHEPHTKAVYTDYRWRIGIRATLGRSESFGLIGFGHVGSFCGRHVYCMVLRDGQAFWCSDV